MTTTLDPERQADLLHFARNVYARPGIQALCLRLQDELDVDVVLLLMCCWHGRYYGPLSEAQFAQAAAFSGSWRAQLVQPVRQARRWLKPHPADAMGICGADQEALRERIKALELDAEFMQLRALAGLSGQPAPDTAASARSESPSTERDATAAIRANLALYASECRLDGGLNEETVSMLTRATLAL